MEKVITDNKLSTQKLRYIHF